MYFSHSTATTWNPPFWFEQHLDEFAIYQRALIPQEVADRATPCTSTHDFTGFHQPVDNLSTLNIMNAGRAVPIKFALGSDQGLGIVAAGYPRCEQIACDSSALVDGIEETLTADKQHTQLRPYLGVLQLHLEDRPCLGHLMPPIRPQTPRQHLPPRNFNSTKAVKPRPPISVSLSTRAAHAMKDSAPRRSPSIVTSELVAPQRNG